jgi:hypothetical protein
MLITGRSRLAEWRAQNLQLSRTVQRFERAISREIARAMRKAAKTLNQPLWKETLEQEHAEKIGKILVRLWTAAGESAASSFIATAKASQKFETKADDITAPMVTRAISEWIYGYGGRKITAVTTTTMQDINKIVAAGVYEGLSERAIGSLIEDAAPIKSASRSQTIARTEAHGASNGISMSVAKQTEIPLLKVWITNIDDRTRRYEDGAEFDHAEANGQKVDLNGFFDVGGERLEYAGDPSGSAANVINCRCVTGYEIDLRD